ncbi:MAG: hypothetical protein U5N85_14980 [Arcicella sp.]|nr:hypothetical protein [Arcicella sp.]
MLKILQQPYPHSDSDKRKILLSLGTGFFIGLFLIYFQPFDIYKFNSPHKILILSGYGVITAATMLLLYFVPPKTFPNYFKRTKLDCWSRDFICDVERHANAFLM